MYLMLCGPHALTWWRAPLPPPPQALATVMERLKEEAVEEESLEANPLQDSDQDYLGEISTAETDRQSGRNGDRSSGKRAKAGRGAVINGTSTAAVQPDDLSNVSGGAPSSLVEGEHRRGAGRGEGRGV